MTLMETDWKWCSQELRSLIAIYKDKDTPAKTKMVLKKEFEEIKKELEATLFEMAGE